MSPASEQLVPLNPQAEALRAGRFCYVVELVASALQREAKLLEVASPLARVPDVVAGSITSYAGRAMGHDSMRVGTAARVRVLTPNVHVTCVGQDRAGLRKTLEDLQSRRPSLAYHGVLAPRARWRAAIVPPPTHDGVTERSVLAGPIMAAATGAHIMRRCRRKEVTHEGH